MTNRTKIYLCDFSKRKNFSPELEILCRFANKKNKLVRYESRDYGIYDNILRDYVDLSDPETFFNLYNLKLYRGIEFYYHSLFEDIFGTDSYDHSLNEINSNSGLRWVDLPVKNKKGEYSFKDFKQNVDKFINFYPASIKFNMCLRIMKKEGYKHVLFLGSGDREEVDFFKEHRFKTVAVKPPPESKIWFDRVIESKEELKYED